MLCRGQPLKKRVPSLFFCLTEYTGNYIYKNGVLEFFNHAEGYVEKEDDGYKYTYQYKDHLGNIRLSFSDSDNDGIITTSEIKEEKNYYPFGLQHKGYNNTVSPHANSTAQKFKFNGVEHEQVLGLDLYEMPLRQYDPAIARWTSIDPVTHHSMSTYTAFDNNPVYWADPSGANSEDLVNEIINKSSGYDSSTWQSNNDGTFSASNGRTAGTETESDDADEDCCGEGGAERMIRQRMADRMAERQGGNSLDWYNTFMSADGDAGYQAGIIGIELIVGEYALIKVFQGVKWVYRVIKTARLAKYSKRISSIRNTFKIGKGRNIAYSEGTIGGKVFSEVGISGKAVREGTVGNPIKRFFSTSNVNGYSRAFDSEVKILESFAQQFSNNTSIKGVLKIVSERQICSSCSSVVSQFRKMFPNVKIKVINGVK